MLDDPELIDEFVEEAAEHLDRIESILTSFGTLAREEATEAVNEVFRGMHSIKGAAGLLELPKVRTLAHAAETVLSAARECTLSMDTEVLQALLRARDRLSEMVEDLAAEAEVDASAELLALEKLLCEESQTGAASSVASEDSPREPSGQEVASAHAERAPPPELAQPQPQVQKSSPPVVVKTPSSSAPATRRPQRGEKNLNESVRVPLWVLDRLMALAGELVLVRNRTRQHFEEKVRRDRNLATGADRRLLQQLDLVTSDLQEAVLRTRMQPIGKLFAKIPKLCRDLGAKLGKNIAPTSIGDEVEVDKTILECLSDPLLHLIRNACDHGLEPPDERTAAGKGAQGSLVVEAKHDAGQISIIITDDGRGVNVDRVAAKAISQGIRRADEIASMSERQICALVFAPGFSTAEKVTDVSGRGVGMDVVRTSIEGIGGTVDVSSKRGQGTTFTLRVPLTLAIVSSLIVRSGGDTFAIPQVNLDEVVRLHRDEGAGDVEYVNQQPVVRVRGKLLPIVHLEDVLAHREGIPNSVLAERAAASTTPDSVLTVAIVRVAEMRFGVIVDEAVGSEEIVVKPNHPSLSEQRCFVGSTILGDGRVALILDVNGVSDHAKLESRFFENVKGAAESTSLEVRQQDLLFTVDGNDRYMVSLGLVNRVVPIPAGDLKRIGNVITVDLKGEVVRVVALPRHLDSAAYPDDADEYLLILPRHIRRPVGFLATKIIDVIELDRPPNADLHRGEFVLGSTMVDGNVALVLDLFALARAEEPSWFDDTVATRGSGKLLLAEDTAFFRKAVSGFLECMGFEVDIVNDGAEALNLLLEHGDSYCGLVSDLEMPNLDGFELIEQLRLPSQVAQLRNLPALALSSLSSPEDRARAIRAGFDRFELKLSRGRLEEAILELTSKDRTRAA